MANTPDILNNDGFSPRGTSHPDTYRSRGGFTGSEHALALPVALGKQIEEISRGLPNAGSPIMIEALNQTVGRLRQRLAMLNNEEGYK